ncbi:hypothetical protein QA596_08440 [Balneolales bacterium ANBcel1]|nr:hypothetical protein [Balneolales bacterium ANBcel1]
MKTVLAFLPILLTVHLDSHARQIVIPDNVIGKWDNVGAKSLTPDRFDSTFTIDCGPGFDRDHREVIQQAIDDAGEASGTNRVHLIGECAVYGNLQLVGGRHDHVYVTGDGPGGTHYRLSEGPATVVRFMNIKTDTVEYRVDELHYNFSAGFVLYGPQRERSLGVIERFDPGSNEITLSQAAAVSKGDLLVLRATSVSGPDGSIFDHLGQMNIVREAGDSTIVLENDFRLTWDHHRAQDNGNDIQVYRVPAPLRNAGISNLGIINDLEGFEDRPSLCDTRVYPDAAECPQHVSHITLFMTKNIHIHNIYSYKPLSRHVYMMRTMHSTIEGSFFNDAYYTAGYGGAYGYGVDMRHYCTLNLIENNIFRHQRTSMNLGTGSHKNVFAYNYSREAFALTGNINRSDLRFRNLSDSGNLFEGNRVDRIRIDAFHIRGGLDSFSYRNTVLRNHSRYSFLEVQEGREINLIGNEARLRNTDPEMLAMEVYGFDEEDNPISHNALESPDLPRLHLQMLSLYRSGKPEYFTRPVAAATSDTAFAAIDSNTSDLSHNGEHSGTTENQHPQDDPDDGVVEYSWPPFGPSADLNPDAEAELSAGSLPAREVYCRAYEEFINPGYRCGERRVNAYAFIENDTLHMPRSFEDAVVYIADGVVVTFEGPVTFRNSRVILGMEADINYAEGSEVSLMNTTISGSESPPDFQ